MRKMTRMECSKEARRVLNRHSVDLNYCQFTCYGHEVRLTGWFVRTDGLDFVGGQIDFMIQDFSRTLPGFLIAGDLDNWHFSSDHISYLGDGGENNAKEDKAQEVYELDLNDYDLKVS